MLPAAVLLSIAGTPLWGPAATFLLLKTLAAAFVLIGILWYRADDTPADRTPAAGPAAAVEERSSTAGAAD